jgi:hypothetical protein
MIKLTGVWANKDKNNETYFSGNLGNARLVMLKNSFKKEGSKEPDYNLYLDESTRKTLVKDDSENTFDD